MGKMDGASNNFPCGHRLRAPGTCYFGSWASCRVEPKTWGQKSPKKVLQRLVFTQVSWTTFWSLKIVPLQKEKVKSVVTRHATWIHPLFSQVTVGPKVAWPSSKNCRPNWVQSKCLVKPGWLLSYLNYLLHTSFFCCWLWWWRAWFWWYYMFVLLDGNHCMYHTYPTPYDTFFF